MQINMLTSIETLTAENKLYSEELEQQKKEITLLRELQEIETNALDQNSKKNLRTPKAHRTEEMNSKAHQKRLQRIIAKSMDQKQKKSYSYRAPMEKAC
ncbi:hypothetical protein JTB14_017336 [Gonioctena quinquepunctata]|nr:hypothetical protein JTB14_017336 [Gonioctena quinquepunctata]